MSLVFITPYGFSVGTKVRLAEWIGRSLKGVYRLLLLREVDTVCGI